MRIEQAKTSGFCFGVSQAVRSAEALLQENNPASVPTYMYGRLIHNDQVIDSLIRRGLRLALTIDEIEPGSQVLIRAHGVTPQEIEQLREKGCSIIDRTCPFVGKIHQIARAAWQNGDTVIIAGSPDHPEVIGINGECDGQAVIISEASEAVQRPFSDKKHVLVSQTTFSTAEYQRIRHILQKKIAKIEIFDTICITTENRQTEAMAIAGKVDVMFVLGSTSSSNTQKLLEICQSRCGETHLIEYPEQVNGILANRDTDSLTIGIIASASTPERIIQEVIHTMTDKEVVQNQQEEKQNLEQEQVQEQVQAQAADPAADQGEPAADVQPEVVETEAVKETAAEETADDAEPVEAAEPEAGDKVDASAADNTADAAKPEDAADVQPEVVETEAVEEAVETKTAEAAETEAVEEAVETEAPEAAEAEAVEDAAAEETADVAKPVETAEADTEEKADAPAPDNEDETDQDSGDISFTDFIDNIPQLKRGATVKGVIVRYDNDHVYVDVRDKSEGRIPRHEFDGDPDFDLDEAIREHKEIDVYVRNIRNSDFGKEIILSKARVDFGKYKALIEEAYNDRTPIIVKVVNVVKDGVIASYGGVDIYVHRTQLEMGIVEDLEPYRGQTLEILVTQYDPDKKRLRVSGSRRALLANERKKKAEELWKTIEVGNKYEGIVRSLTDFGAFVDIGGVDGLVHVSELSWKRIRHPSDVVSVGDKVEVHVKDFDAERKRISLGYKKAEDDPYHDVESRFPVGSIVRGIVVRMFPFGAFVEIAPGVDALCHISQIANVRLNKPNDVLTEGMEVDARVLEVSNESRRISISIKEVEPINPEGYEETLQDGMSGFSNQSELDRF